MNYYLWQYTDDLSSCSIETKGYGASFFLSAHTLFLFMSCRSFFYCFHLTYCVLQTLCMRQIHYLFLTNWSVVNLFGKDKHRCPWMLELPLPRINHTPDTCHPTLTCYCTRNIFYLHQIVSNDPFEPSHQRFRGIDVTNVSPMFLMSWNPWKSRRSLLSIPFETLLSPLGRTANTMLPEPNDGPTLTYQPQPLLFAKTYWWDEPSRTPH